MLLEGIRQSIDVLSCHTEFGRVTGIQGMLVEIGGIHQSLGIGGRCIVTAPDGGRVPCEVVGFRDGRTLAMPLGPSPKGGGQVWRRRTMHRNAHTALASVAWPISLVRQVLLLATWLQARAYPQRV